MDNKLNAAWRAVALAAMVGLLAGCAGTIKQDLRVTGDVSRVDGVVQVVALMSPDATRLQGDNPQFSRDELANYLRRRLEAKGLLAPAATHKVQVVITDIRVRSAVVAVLLGFMAGDDHVTGRVQVLDPSGKPLRSFEVKASYALGGWAGGQDGMRMNWMYDKFSELATAELEKVINKPSASALAQPAPYVAPIAAIAGARAPVAGAAAINDVNAVPVSDKGKEVYRDWLSRRNPRAFVVAEGGYWTSTYGTSPKDPMEPRNPAERALKRCGDAGRTGCTLYAVDNNVVFVKPAEPIAQAPQP